MGVLGATEVQDEHLLSGKQSGADGAEPTAHFEQTIRLKGSSKGDDLAQRAERIIRESIGRSIKIHSPEDLKIEAIPVEREVGQGTQNPPSR